MIIFLPILILILAVVLIYFVWVRPRFLTWGATKDEASQPLTGDEIVQKPHFVATRAVSIKAPPTEVWKWILQIGSARAGWYSYDFVDNGGVKSSFEILPQFQRIELDYFVPFTPDQKNGMWVKSFQEPQTILWWDKKGKSTWLWQLKAVGTDQTRLITRLRTRYDFSFPWIIYYAFYDFGDIIMMKKCMLGIKERAENHYRQSSV